eukprot:TRINITY_DN10018_c0_g1_i1.p1 TRINITY_DN10018_c0_g1~~TRINITY_DN10018_c0_g1_i1.p1  ORF type:complete len:468 (-),score=81.61 TRINITY_DN10018_c0_g1_i1:39-1442(-)
MFWRSQLLHGPCKRIWENWFDLFIVVTGIVEQWLAPILNIQTAGDLKLLRFLRLLRLVRAVRLCAILRKYIKYVDENDTFVLFIMGVISLNCVLMGVQINYPEWSIWPYLENMFLAIFVFEIFVRMLHWRCYFFSRRDPDGNPNQNFWFNWLDFIIVAGGVIDSWLIPVLSWVSTEVGGPPISLSSLGEAVMVLRMMRLVRLLRLIRLVRSIPPLYNLLMGIIDAMQGMMWLLVLTTATIYIIALLAIKLWGKDGLLMGDSDPEEVTKVFPSTLLTMWVLFMAMNGDPSGMQPLFDAHPESIFFAVVFMIFSSFAILSVLTGVVADKMATANEEHDKLEEDKANASREKDARVLLEQVFKNATQRSSSKPGGKAQLMTKDDYVAAISNVMDDLHEVTGMENDEIESAFDSLSRHIVTDTKGNAVHCASKEDFIEGMLEARNPSDKLSIRRIEKQLTELRILLEKSRK